MVLFLVLAATLLWAGTEVFLKVALNNKGSEAEVFVHAYSFPLLYVTVLAPFAIVQGWQMTSELWMLGAVTALCYVGGTVTYLIAMGFNDASRVAGLAAAYPILTATFMTMGGEQARWLQVTGTLAAVAGITLIESGGANKAATGKERVKLFMLLGCTVVLWSIVPIADGRAVQTAGPMATLLSVAVSQSLLWLVVVAVLKRKGHVRPRAPFAKFAWGAGLCAMFGNMAYSFALAEASSTYVAAITSLYPVPLFLLAVTLLGEKASLKRGAGVALAAIGAALVHFAS